jgi:hypothetical protein
LESGVGDPENGYAAVVARVPVLDWRKGFDREENQPDSTSAEARKVDQFDLISLVD